MRVIKQGRGAGVKIETHNEEFYQSSINIIFVLTIY